MNGKVSLVSMAFAVNNNMSEAGSPSGLTTARLIKTRTMASFVRTRFRIIDMMNDGEIVVKSQMKLLRELLTADMQKAMDALEVLYSLTDDSSKDRVQEEMDKLLSEYQETLQAAQQYGISNDHASDTRSVVSDVPDHDVEGAHDQEVDDNVPHPSPPDKDNKLEQDMWRQLKRVAIPVFSGNKRTFESWKAAFTACIDKSPSSAEYKLLQLRQYLSGDALKAIENLGHSAASYEAAKERLDRKFGGTRRYIAARMEEVDNFRPVRPGYARDVDKFADMVDVVVINLKESNRLEELGYGSLYFKLLKKLPESMIRDYQRWIFENSRHENVESLKDWINQESQFQIIASETVKGLSSDQNLKSTDANRRREQTLFTRQPGCACCQEQGHAVWKCSQFKQLEVPARWQLAKDKKLCFRCLGVAHVGRSCQRSRSCGLDGCAQLHHRLLHKNTTSATASNTATWSGTPAATYPMEVQQPVHSLVTDYRGFVASDNITMMSKDKCDSFVALRTVPVILRNGNKVMKVNALLDDGSTKTYINADVADELQLVGESQQVTVNVLNGQCETFKTRPVDVQLQSVDGAVDIKVSAFTTNRVTGLMKPVDWNKYRNKWSHLSRINFPKLGCRPIVDMLIGLDCADLHAAMTEVRGSPGQPIARLTPLGWTCIGNPTSDTGVLQTNFVYTYFLHETPTIGEINDTLQKFWQVESVQCDEHMLSVNDRMILQKSKESMVYSENMYEVRIPWKDDTPMLPNSYEMAVRRLEGTEKRLRRDSSVGESYCATIEQYVEKDYIRKVENDSVNQPGWYLPHFPVVRLDKATTKTRIVFDASATHEGVSLNQSIHQGPKLQRELVDVLIRFRKHQVAVACDISEMYLRIKMSVHDRSYFRFLWRDMKSDRKPDVYEFNRVVFGANCSPFLAQLVIQEHAKKFSGEYPLAAETLLKSTYMDDSMDSVPSDRQGIELYNQLSSLLKLANMNAHKWLTNSNKVLQQIPVEERASEVEIEGEVQGTKTLGILWNAADDVFTFRSQQLEADFIFTKRTVLKKVAALFDPLGFLAPYVVRAKILLQNMWLAGKDWDEPLDGELKSQAECWFSELKNIGDIRVMRCLRSLSCDECNSMSIHVFVDASCEAYGAVVYTRCSYVGGNSSCHLVCSKSRVAPLTATSIPRLELMAAVLGLRLSMSVANVLEIPVHDVNYWSDSMNVLYWIRGRSRSYKPFVANRIGEIQTVTNPCQWRYVPTQLNPADIVSRGISALQLVNEDRWFSGPEFLVLSEDCWPNQPIEPVAQVFSEMKRSDCNSTFVTLSCSPVKLSDRLDPERYSDWKRFTRVHAWVRRFVNNCRSLKQDRMRGELHTDEIQESEVLILKACQQQAFASEYRALIQKTSLPVGSKLLVLNPVLDDDGLIRSNSRLVNADILPYDARYPVVLPRKHAVTRLIIKFEHKEGLHVSGTNRTLSELSKRYWIISAREAIREWESTCMTCKRRTAKVATQVMAPLPMSRLQLPDSLRCFVRTGLDFAGPFLTIQGRGRCREKRYLCLFTCLATRAVHLEMSYGLDTDSFLNAFYRFVNRRGYPEQLISDNGTNFVGANRELQELIAKLDQLKIQKSTVSHGLRWDFNPPAAPHFGGVFEVMIKAAKRAITAILGQADVNDEELSSAFIGAEALLNSRPLTYQSASPHDITPLTPSHFLHGELGRRTAPTPVDDVRHPRKRWRRVQELIRHFWTRWIREWLPSLSPRKKWRSSSRDVAVGDIVLVMNPQAARGTWPMGRILQVYPGNDGHVRMVNVQVGQTVLRRPVTALCPFEFDSTDC